MCVEGGDWSRDLVKFHLHVAMFHFLFGEVSRAIQLVSQLFQDWYGGSISFYVSVCRGHVDVHSNLRGICFGQPISWTFYLFNDS